MNMGRPIGPWGRAFVRPIGVGALLLALGAMGVMLAVTRLPLGRPSIVELRYYSQPQTWKALSKADQDSQRWLFEGAIVLTLVATATYFIRALLLLMATARFRGYRPYRRKRFFRHGAVLLAMGIAIIGLFMGWPYRIGRQWVKREIASPTTRPTFDLRGFASTTPPPNPLAPPIPLPADREAFAIEAASRSMPRSEERLTALKLLATNHPEAIAGAMARLAPHEKDAEVCAAELHLLGISRSDTGAAVFEKMLSDSRPGVRAAAADGLGIRFASSFQLEDEVKPRPNYWTQEGVRSLGTTPPIDLEAILQQRAAPAPPNAIQRAELMKIMLAGESSEEREAAARALLPFPPAGYRLRVAEWGVWAGQADRLEIATKFLDEIPAFVHQTRNRVSEFSDRIGMPIPIMVYKPIIHLTVNEPMAVDLSVLIESGRPWYAYPKPDDFSISLDDFSEASGRGDLKSFEGPELLRDLKPKDELSDARDGYPWLLPHHKIIETSGQGNDTIKSVGLHWQSLIVSPQKLPWMLSSACGADPKYDWWNKLRDVPCAWISSRGEAERFLYYDGPTGARIPASVYLEGDTISVLGRRIVDQNFPSHNRRDGLFISVAAGQPTAKHVSIGIKDEKVQLRNCPDQTGPAAIAMFRQMLIEAGLTDAEAGGLIVSWKHHFFETDGKRFLLIMSASDYDTLCPIQVHPTPTEMARVGIVLTEF
jgi:hypothetical protein